MSISSEIRRRTRLQQIAETSDATPIGAMKTRDQDLSIRDPDVEPSGALKQIGEPDDEDSINMDDLGYKEETAASKKFDELLAQYPKDRGPSLGRAIVAGGLAVGPHGSYKDSQDFLSKPHTSEVEDWKNQAQPYYNAANLERQSNINNRTLAYNTAQAKNAEKRNQILEDRYNDQAEAAIMRNLINKYKAEQYKIVTMGTRIKAVNPHDPNDVKDIGDSGKMDQRELEDLKGGYQVKAAEARGTAAVATAQAGAQVTGKDLITVDGNTYKYDPETKSYKYAEDIPYGTPTRPGTPPRTTGTGTTKTNTLESNRIRNKSLEERYQTDPISKQYIKSLGGGKYDFKPRPVLGATVGSTFGMGGTTVTQQDVDNYDQFRQEVDPSYNPRTELSRGIVDHSQDHPTYFPGQKDIELPSGKKTAPTGNMPNQNKSGTLRVMDPKTGRTGTIPNTRESIDAAMKKGLRVEVGR